MKVYIVKAPQGEYEDYKEPIVKVFIDKAKAKKYVEEENANLFDIITAGLVEKTEK